MQIGNATARLEDFKLVRGEGSFTADFSFPNEAYLYVLRSPHAHANIVNIDSIVAVQSAGVIGIFTGHDLAADGLGCAPMRRPPLGPLSKMTDELVVPPNYALPKERVRFVGEPVAIVVAETLDQARQAAELIEVEYEPLGSISGIQEARAASPEHVRVWEQAPGNLCGAFEIGDKEACRQAFRNADKIISTSLSNNRVIGSPMEPRAAVGLWDEDNGELTLIAGTQMPNPVHQTLADHVFKIDRDRLRVISPDMGGGFGTRTAVFPEYVFVLWCARKTLRPVKWLGDRTEAFLSDPHGRDSHWTAELAVKNDGTLLGLRVETWANIGAYGGANGALVPVYAGPRVQTGVYRIPALDMRVGVLFSNTSTVQPYRGAGQPEAIYLIERLIDLAAMELGLDRVDIRRRNLIAKDAFPFRAASGSTYDSGEYEVGMDMALELSDWRNFASRRQQSLSTGKLRGIGIANYVQVSGGRPDEWAKLEVQQDRIVFIVGTHSHGQGHITTLSQVLADQLGADLSRIDVVQGDTKYVKSGGGTHGSRSLFKAGELALKTSQIVMRQASWVAATMFEVHVDDVFSRDGNFAIKNTNFSANLFELARYAKENGHLFPELEDGLLCCEMSVDIHAENYPSGTHICEVEVDPETGVAEVIKYTAVDDAGHIINPLICAGQSHGGIVQGIGQALHEKIHYTAGEAQLTTASFMDYTLPRASHVPPFDIAFQEVRSPTNQLGVKGIGESGSTGAPPAIIGAIADALKDYGVQHIEMPATPERIWEITRGRRLQSFD